ncbi:RNA binding domain-containing protein 39, variant [Capsaspora owczarzaki ATCC 30864]|uniref:RNA binding domain-containing protein 39, variant n=1 Tax=Capsaspora owczarzaki (strain ATCC 30864) TaxID=595528 RepID=A0A0D2U1S5_CAPO3|nr:RNA binding domain-containing protein 39, variant [Capsaspora owczarzaki ATCC 30864]
MTTGTAGTAIETAPATARAARAIAAAVHPLAAHPRCRRGLEQAEPMPRRRLQRRRRQSSLSTSLVCRSPVKNRKSEWPPSATSDSRTRSLCTNCPPMSASTRLNRSLATKPAAAALAMMGANAGGVSNTPAAIARPVTLNPNSAAYNIATYQMNSGMTVQNVYHTMPLHSSAVHSAPLPAAPLGTAAIAMAAKQQTRVYVGSLDFALTEADVKSLFSPCGEVISVTLNRDNGKSKGYAFVQFADAGAAKLAMELNGVEVAGRPLKVNFATDPEGRFLNAPNAGPPMGMPPMGLPPMGMPPMGLPPMGLPPMGLPPMGLPPMDANPTADLSNVAIETQFLLLKNMFDPAQERDPEWQLDIRDTVLDECVKHGSVTHIFVDANSPGFVFIKFSSVEACIAVQRTMHGRWFAGKLITADYVPEPMYHARFPESRDATVALQPSS